LKNTHKLIILAALIIGVIFLLNACAKKECEAASDCGQNTKCITFGCSVDNKCMRNIKPDCCGNLKCESEENSCTCISDCGDCSKKGKVKYNITSGRTSKTIEAKFAQYLCEENNCIIGVNPDSANELRLTGTLEEKSIFKFDLLNVLNQPFDVSKDKYNVRITLSDLNAKIVSSGISITSIQVLNGNFLLGEEMINSVLANVGATINQTFALTTSQTLPEEDMTLTLKIDYSYTPLDSKGNQLQIKRTSQKVVISSTKITMVKP
jgi:hypothetical protein